MSKEITIPPAAVCALATIVQQANPDIEFVGTVVIAIAAGSPPTLMSNVDPSQIDEILDFVVANRDHRHAATVHEIDDDGTVHGGRLN